MKPKKQHQEVFSCPSCGSREVTTAHIQTFMVNTGEHYCHSVKTQDSDSPAFCLDCQWEGQRKDLEIHET
jgi:transcription elongation factor Elf1